MKIKYISFLDNNLHHLIGKLIICNNDDTPNSKRHEIESRYVYIYMQHMKNAKKIFKKKIIENSFRKPVLIVRIKTEIEMKAFHFCFKHSKQKKTNVEIVFSHYSV